MNRRAVFRLRRARSKSRPQLSNRRRYSELPPLREMEEKGEREHGDGGDRKSQSRGAIVISGAGRGRAEALANSFADIRRRSPKYFLFWGTGRGTGSHISRKIK